jgi:DNA-binding response OmpR family regulator
MAGRILLIEDEEKIARVLELELRHENYEVKRASNGREGLQLALSEPWDIILLDIMLPEMSGLEVLQNIREQNAAVPIILLTARDSVQDKVIGLDLGANDYVTKPFVIEELLARIRSLLRTAQLMSDQEECYVIDDLTVDCKSRRVVRSGQPIDLTPREFDLLVYLLQNQETVLTREQILSDVWGYDFAGDTNLVDVYIRYLRQKIDKGFKVKLIHTSRGVGYFIRDPQQEAP